MLGSSLLLRQFLSSLSDEQPPPSFTLTAAGNFNQSQALTSRSFHAIVLFIIPVLLNLLDLLYHDGTSPFSTHPKTMRFAIICLLAYCWVYGVSSASYALMLGMMLLGSLSVASLVSIFVPDTLQWLVYVLYTLMWMSNLLFTFFGFVKALVRSTWDRCRRAFPFCAPSLLRHTSSDRGSILPL